MERTAVRGETPLGEAVREASMRLPERQREALALSGLERHSYEEVAAIMETSAGAVAQLISRARINLYDELRGTTLASVAAPSPDCERALPLIAAREDGQLGSGSDDDAAWLDAHLAVCDRCRLGAEQMGEVNDAYRGGTRVDAPESSSGAPLAIPSSRSRVRLSRGQATFAGALGILLLLGGLATAFVGNDGSPAPATPAADAATGRGIEKSEPDAKPVTAGSGKDGVAKEKAKASTTAAERNGDEASAADAAPTPVTVPAPPPTGGGAPSAPSSGPTRPVGKTGVEPTKQTSAPKSTSEPKPPPTATPTSQPASGPTTTPTEAPPPAEDPPDGPGRSDEAPGKPSDHPPR
jgi:Sigma-70, region 4